MNSKLFVGGLPYETTQADLHKLFSTAGAVFGVKLVVDRETGRSKGFAFVEMATEADAKAAMRKLDGAFIGTRKLFISVARPQERKAAPGDRPASAAKAPFVPPPGFVERRSGKDRRQRPGFGSPAGPAAAGAFEAPDRRKAPAERKVWADKKPWSARKAWADKPGGYEKKPWSDLPTGGKSGGKKPAGKHGGFARKPRRDRG